MRVIGVIDLLDGRAVHARAGRRETYEPIERAGVTRLEPGDASGLARWYVNQLDVGELYIADLNAIRTGDWQTGVISALASVGAPFWLDAGIRSTAQALAALDFGAARVIVGLETLPSYDTLADICAAFGDRVAFSLDLRRGEPVIAAGAAGATSDIPRREPAHQAARRAADAGARTLIVIDLARVGTLMGPDFRLIARVRETTPALTLVAGGGIRGQEDLERLAECGCDAALVATAMQDGRIGVGHVAAIRRQGTATR